MEFELQHTKLEGHQLFLDAILTQEETLDSIIPDAFPDATRVVSAIGNGYITNKQISEGNVRIGGTACVNIIYIPEGEDHICAIPLSVPFQCLTDNNQIDNSTLVHAEIISVCADARLINPRKLFLKAEIRVHVTAFNGETRTVISDIASHIDLSLQKKSHEYTDYIISTVLEKPFSFSDILHPSASKPSIDELLFWTIRPGIVEAKYIGKKVICKGEFVLSAFYQFGAELTQAEFEVPFSQIIEIEGSFEEGIPDVTIAVRSASCSLTGGELEISVDAIIQTALWSQRRIILLSDAYSTAIPLDTERNKCMICSISEQSVRRENYRKFCESELPAKKILWTTAQLTPMISENTDSGVLYNSSSAVSILYAADDDSLHSVTYTIPISIALDVPAERTCTCKGKPVGEVTVLPVTGGFEVRVEIEFCWRILGYQAVQNVVSMRRSTVASENERKPSLILRKVEKEDDLWSIAKSCCSTIEDICTANKLTSEIPQPGSILLIPIHR